ncbi:MAG TPA: glycosyltransferase family 4 protein, partial [Gemmatimonadales bacterium]|nr:glycosyltransferase family 4 protein [Gemmatimonadales bacterium]
MNASTPVSPDSSALNVLWVIDHICYDGAIHAGGRLYWHLLPAFDPARVRVHPYFLRARADVLAAFAGAPVAVTNLDKGKYDPTTLTTLLRLCREHRADVLHLFCHASSTFGRIVAAMTGVPTVVHDFDSEVYFPSPAYLDVVDRLLARYTGHAFAASSACRDYMHAKRRIPADRIDVLAHAIPRERFATAARLERPETRAALRGELGWGPDEVVFFTPTKLGIDRGNELLVRAFARVAVARPEARLVVWYKPTYYHRVPKEYAHLDGLHDVPAMRRALEALARAEGVAGRVTLVEAAHPTEQPDRFYAAADALVAPFQHARFSSVDLFEGLAHGRAAITTALGTQRELLHDGVDALLVPPGDETALAEAMTRLAADPALRLRLGAAAA